MFALELEDDVREGEVFDLVKIILAVFASDLVPTSFCVKSGLFEDMGEKCMKGLKLGLEMEVRVPAGNTKVVSSVSSVCYEDALSV